MSELNLTPFLTDFAALPDSRLARRRQHPLLKILLLCVSASLSGYEEWDEIVDFGLAKLAWLRRYLPFCGGHSSTRHAQPGDEPARAARL